MLNEIEIPAIDKDLCDLVQIIIDGKTKPKGSLGRLEEMAVQIAGIQNTNNPAVDPAHLLLFAADHGLVEEGVSAWPSEVTAKMVANFLQGGAAANIFANTNDVEMTIIDGGVIADIKDDPGVQQEFLRNKHHFLRANIRRGTRNALIEDALTADEVHRALSYGAHLGAIRVEAGFKTVLLGEMGIGNSSTATLLAHGLTGISIEDLTGPGAGLDQQGVQYKIDILKQVAGKRLGNVEKLAAGSLNGEQALAKFGGLEIAMMAGAMIGAASQQGVVIIDGYIATAAALCALKTRPEVMDYMIFSHLSHEPGHKHLVSYLNKKPLLDLDLRLGEGTGAIVALPLLRSSVNMLNEMASFETVGIKAPTTKV